MLDLSGLQQRAKLLQAIRSFFIAQDYIEVDTPIRLPHLIPEANILPLKSEDHYLQTSPELCMKMLLARGCSKIFQICHCFRSEERGRFHQTEFTMLEWYQCGWDYNNLMAECENLLQSIAKKLPDAPGVNRQGELVFKGKDIMLSAPWQRISVAEAFRVYGRMSVNKAMQKDLFDEVMVEDIEPNLGWKTPTFLYDYPLAMASLSRPKLENPEVAERFELYVGGIELANGFSELVDSQVQRMRFEMEVKSIRTEGREAVLPEQFLDSLAQIDSAAGIALGIDRLLMLFMGCEHIDDVLPFPEGFLHNN